MLIAEGDGIAAARSLGLQQSRCGGVQFVWEVICNYKDVIFLFGGVLFPLLLCSQEIVPLVGSNETGEKSLLRG